MTLKCLLSLSKCIVREEHSFSFLLVHFYKIFNCATKRNFFTDMSILSKFSKVGNCGINFCTTLLNASNILWSYIEVKWKLKCIWSHPGKEIDIRMLNFFITVNTEPFFIYQSQLSHHWLLYVYLSVFPFYSHPTVRPPYE